MINIIIELCENKGFTWMILTIGAKKYLSLYNVIYILIRILRYNICQQYVAKGAHMITDHTTEAHFSLDINLHET